MVAMLWTACAAAALGSGCGAGSQDGGAHAIEFPGPWLKAGEPSTVLTLPGTYQVRRDAAAGGADLLFAFETADGSASANVHAVSADGNAVRVADTGQWDRAQPVSQSRRALRPDAPDSVEFKGRRYGTPGRIVGRAIVSPDDRRLAILSYVAAASDATRSIGSFIGGGEPSAGDLYLDVYSTADGARIASGQASWNGFGPGVLFGAASWIASDIVVVPVDTLAQRTLLVLLGGG
jgi:hypothetical protein